MIATKEQERKALEEIKKIVDGLGEGSYIGIVFGVCFEIAEQGIRNDRGIAFAQEIKDAAHKATRLQKTIVRISKERDEALAEVERLKGKILSAEDARRIKDAIADAYAVSDLKVQRAAYVIVECAEDPGSEDFIVAVREHRAHQRKLEKYRSINRMLDNLLR